MKGMKRIIVFAFACLLTFVACNKIDVPGEKPVIPAISPVFTASINGGVKTAIDAASGKVSWENTDEITVSDAASHTAVYKITSIDQKTGSATFEYKSGEVLDQGSTYTATYGSEPELIQIFAETAGNLYMTAPATSKTDFTFTVQCGLMRINLTKSGERVRSVSVTGKPADGMEEATYILNCPGAQSISAEKDFFITLPEGSYTLIEITNSHNVKCALRSSGVTVGANHIKPVTLGEEKLVFDYYVPGLFSVSENSQVRFAKGNLQATYDGNAYYWGFATNQYDFVGNAAGNTTMGTSQAEGSVVDLFGWSTDATNNNWGINTSKFAAPYGGNFSDWGPNIGDGWRTLSSSEWNYLFTGSKRAGLYAYGVTVMGKTNCVILYPDGYTGTKVDNNDTESFDTESEWSAAQNAGVVCLPAAGYRTGSAVYVTGTEGRYWSSTPKATEGLTLEQEEGKDVENGSDSDSYAKTLQFTSSSVNPANEGTRYVGRSVRLVSNVTE